MSKYPQHVPEWARLYQEEGLSLRKIASRYNCSPGTVRKHLKAAGVDTSTGSVRDRFWKKVSTTTDPGGCWEWNASFTGAGYPAFWFNGTTIGAHQASYILNRGSIPEGKVICHLCHNPKCVRPDHLAADTQKENMEQMRAAGRGWWQK